MKDLIKSVDLKLERADSQFRSLTDEISAWTSRNSIAVRRELLEGGLGFRLVVEDFAVNAPTDHWGLLLGELVHNLRTSLDNLAFALARLQCDPPKQPRAISFPIFQDKSDFEKYGHDNLRQMPIAAAQKIERLQPFQRDGSMGSGTPESDPLLLLRRLSNSDKHRVPPVVLIAPKDVTHSVKVEFYSEEDAKANVPPNTTVSAEPLRAGLVVLEYKTNRPIKSVRGDCSIKAAISLEVIRRQVPMVAILNILKYTGLVVNQFRKFF